MYSKYGFLILSLVVAGCATEPETSGPITSVQFTSQPSARLVGYESTPVKVLVKEDRSKPASRFVKASGVPCKMFGQSFEASFTAPATVRVPDFGRKSSQITVSCTYDGETQTQQFSPYDATANRASNAATQGFGLLTGVIVGSIVSAAVAKDKNNNNDWKYPPIQIKFGAKKVEPAAE